MSVFRRRLLVVGIAVCSITAISALGCNRESSRSSSDGSPGSSSGGSSLSGSKSNSDESASSGASSHNGSGSSNSPSAERVITISAGDLLEERFESDGEAFSKKYSNSTLVVEGAVDTTDDEYLEKYGFFVVRLGGGGRSLGSVRCVFEGYNVAEAKKIKKGTVVRVKGKYSGSGKLEVGVKQCQIMPN